MAVGVPNKLATKCLNAREFPHHSVKYHFLRSGYTTLFHHCMVLLRVSLFLSAWRICSTRERLSMASTWRWNSIRTSRISWLNAASTSEEHSATESSKKLHLVYQIRQQVLIIILHLNTGFIIKRSHINMNRIYGRLLFYT